MRRNFLKAGLAMALALALTRPALAADDQQQTVDDSLAALRAMKADTGITKTGLLRRAKAVLIVPSAVSAAFGIGGTGGRAVLLVRTAHGWSDPAFYSVASASAGFQIGAKEVTSVLLIMTDRALRSFLQDSNVTIGAQANLTAVRYDVNRVATLGDADTILWSKTEGFFAGGAVQAQGFVQNTESDRAYYGRDVNASQIAAGAVRNRGADRLRAAL
jgi:lipid-binding SYLF domain-containing protein